MTKPADTSRVPMTLAGLPVVRGLARSADAQARWMRDMVEQNARLLSQLPDTLRSFNDALERFNDSVARLDRAVTRVETATRTISGPMERVAAVLDPKGLPGAGLVRRLAGGRDARQDLTPAL